MIVKFILFDYFVTSKLLRGRLHAYIRAKKVKLDESICSVKFETSTVYCPELVNTFLVT